MRTLDRRTTIAAFGSVAASLAGASGLAAAQGEGEAGGDEEGDEPEFDEWFEDTNGFDEIDDGTDSDEVSVAVGAGEDGYEFEPTAIRITPGTTVTWEWIDDEDQHDVTHQPRAESEVFEDVDEDDVGTDPEFESDLVEEEGHTFEHDFEEGDGGRTYLYVCTAHEPEGMRGAIVVDEEDEGDDGDD